MHQFLSSSTFVKADKNLDYSTRYDDQELFPNRPQEVKHDWLRAKIASEITLCSHCLLKLERLIERYKADGVAAEADGQIGYYFCYVEGYERLEALINAGYAKLHSVELR